MSHPNAECSDLRYSNPDRRLEGAWSSPQHVSLRNDKGLEACVYISSLGQHLCPLLLRGGSSGKLVTAHLASPISLPQSEIVQGSENA